MMPDGSLSGTAIGPLQEAKQQLLLAAPVSVTFLLNKSVNLVSVLVRYSFQLECSNLQTLLPPTLLTDLHCP